VSSVVIRVESLSKRYRLGQVGGTTLREDWQRWIARLRGRPDPTLKVTEANVRDHKGQSDYVWALKDINFEVAQGEALGIIGKNGAGKSTLLKILSRVTAPTQGCVKIKGRIASLLEVGTGFHPELTGRENIYLNGAVLGMTRAEVRRKLDEIIAFSGCERYIDTPVKRYSSGMTVRLGFAVAAHLDPEILIVDEVLAVGDAEFQKKCLGKMKDVAGHGRTVLFVSHNMVAVKNLCSRAVLLKDGGVELDAPSDRAVATYIGAQQEERLERLWPDPASAPGDGGLWLRRVAVEAEPMDPLWGITTESQVRIVAEAWNNRPGATLNFSLVLYTVEDVCVFNTWSAPAEYPQGLIEGSCLIPASFLNDERYRVRLLVVQDGAKPLFDSDDLLTFEVKERHRGGAWHGKVVGAIRPRLEWRTRAVPASQDAEGLRP